MIRTILYVLIWIALGVPGIGWGAAELSQEFPRQDIRKHLSFAVGWGMAGGPIASGIAFFLVSGFAEYGWCITVQSCKEIAAEKGGTEK